MSPGRFVCEPDPTDERCRQLESTAPLIPYYTAGYRAAMQACGRSMWLLGVGSESTLQYGCLGEVERGRLRRELHIQSTPGEADATFWNGLTGFCKAQGITTLRLATVGTAPSIPVLGLLEEERQRQEYWVDLTVPDVLAPLRPELRRVFRRAREAGLTLRQPELASGLERHAELTSASLGRRRSRGESIPMYGESGIAASLIRKGVARMFECVRDETALGSVIFTVSGKGVHGYSAGYSPEGMKSGAGVFLNVCTFQMLQEEGKVLFNLGDAPPESGLALFKKGLGGVPHDTTSSTFSVASPLRRTALAAESWIRGRISGFRR